MPRCLITLACVSVLLLVPLSAQEKLSDKLHLSLRSTLPVFDEPSATTERPAPELETVVTREPQPINDEPIVHLPDFSVDSNRRNLGRDSDLWLSHQGRADTALRDYANSMTSLEWALNSWHIPLVTSSAQARANEHYRSKRIRLQQTRLLTLASAVKQLDAADGDRLLRALDLQSLPRR